jgi:hypothetical protein
MASKAIAFMAGALVVLGSAALYISSRDSSSYANDADPLAGEPALPELEGLAADALVAVELTDRDGSVRLERRGVAWILPTVDGYPARTDRVTELMRGLQTLRLIEAGTARADKHARVGLVAPGDGGEEAVLVRVELAGGDAPAEILLGNSDTSRSGDALFVRRPDEDQCWVANGRIPRPTSATWWFDARTVTIPTSEVRRVSIAFEERPDQSYTLRRDDPDTFGFELAPLPEGRVPGEEWKWSGLARTAGNLTAADVQGTTSFESAAAGSHVEYARFDLETYEGLRLEARLARLASDVDGVPGPTWIRYHADVVEDGAGPASPAAPERDLAAARTRADELNARLDGWWFEVPAGTAAGYWTPLEDLLAPLPEEPAEQPVEAPPATDGEGDTAAEAPTEGGARSSGG